MAPPVVSEGPEINSELPLNLPPSSRSMGGQYGAAYGPTGTIVAPPGSTGSSRDIRYRMPGRRRATTSFVEPRSAPQIVQPSPIPQATSPDLPVNVPETTNRSTRNGNGKTPPASQQPKPAETDEATGIPHYLIVEANVAAGGQPTLDGFKWLKERGFRTVLNLLPESDADPAEPSMVRDMELEYISLPVTPDTINRATVEMFNQIVDDAKHRPLYIHDSSGTRTGALWYLHRVSVDNVPEDRARNQADRIGLKETDTEFWIAIQRYLLENK
jgi:protein tyrosine phosphatase (PTP) superfamily phosphohydrolase (DUF442 family)